MELRFASSDKDSLVKMNKIDTVTLGLKEAILNGDIRGGEKLSSEEICKRFGVSRAPVREALRRLESDGLVEIYPQQYVIVTNISASDFEELLQIRQSLEHLALDLFIKRYDKEGIDALAALVEREQGETDEIALLEIALAFHNTLCQYSNNSELVYFYGKVMEKYRRFLALEYYNPLYDEQKYHAQILDGLQNKEFEKCYRALEKDIEDCGKIVLVKLRALELNARL
ncbi:GntR family transcriptional regulator [Bacteroides sp. OttesenSCG-928-J23]|nr:GntR family transcriptional regulator [Bacteroides sp. OttesenSCG-928-J23]